MKRLLAPLALAALALANGRAAPPAEPGPPLLAVAADPAWQPLFAALAGRGALVSRVTERRWFPFRREPIVLDGELRLAPDHGLSLHYARPEERTLIADARGLVLRDAAGRDRELPADPRATALGAALGPILRFDHGELARLFTLHGARDGADWRLDLVPRDEALGRALGRVTIVGRDTEVRRLEIRQTEKQRVEIEITATDTGVIFTAAALRRYFR
ncbi:MAG: hypothetical protein RLZZ15_4555 [Verrucomicrobiota bacterium]